MEVSAAVVIPGWAVGAGGAAGPEESKGVGLPAGTRELEEANEDEEE